jgi:plastocyanin
VGFLGHHRSIARLFIALTAALALGVAALLPLRAGTRDEKPRRDVVLVARDMAFYLEGEGLENPTLRFKAGEEIHLVLRNEETGVAHDFSVREWNVATRRLQGRGSDMLTFRVPDRPGRYDYLCNPHASMMRGIIEVE